MDPYGHVYLGEDPPDEDVERLRQAIAEDESGEVMERVEQLRDAAPDAFGRLEAELADAMERANQDDER